MAPGKTRLKKQLQGYVNRALRTRWLLQLSLSALYGLKTNAFLHHMKRVSPKYLIITQVSIRIPVWMHFLKVSFHKQPKKSTIELRLYRCSQTNQVETPTIFLPYLSDDRLETDPPDLLFGDKTKPTRLKQSKAKAKSTAEACWLCG